MTNAVIKSKEALLVPRNGALAHRRGFKIDDNPYRQRSTPWEWKEWRSEFNRRADTVEARRRAGLDPEKC